MFHKRSTFFPPQSPGPANHHPRDLFFSSLHQVMCPLCAVCLQGWDLFTNISAQDFCFSNRAPHCACKLRLPGGDLFTFFLQTCNVHVVVRGAPPWGRLRRQSVSSSFTRSPPRWWCGQPAGDDTILQTIFNQAIFININADTKSPPNQSFHLILNFHKYLQ